jgi:hypothetical protein
MPYKDEEKRRAYDKARERRAYDKERYHTNEKRRAAVLASRRKWYENLTDDEYKQLLVRNNARPCRSPAARRKEHLKGRYGLTLEQWDAMFEA